MDDVAGSAAGLAGLDGHRSDRVVRHFIGNMADNVLGGGRQGHLAGAVSGEDAEAVDRRHRCVRGGPGDRDLARVVRLIDHGGLVAHGDADVIAPARLGDLDPVERGKGDRHGHGAADPSGSECAGHDLVLAALEGLDFAGGAIDGELAASVAREEEEGHVQRVAAGVVRGGGDRGRFADLQRERGRGDLDAGDLLSGDLRGREGGQRRKERGRVDPAACLHCVGFLQVSCRRAPVEGH